MDYDEIHEDLFQDSRTFINEALAGWDQNGNISEQCLEELLDLLFDYNQLTPASDAFGLASLTVEMMVDVCNKYADRYISERMSNG